MTVYVLIYDVDYGSREDCNIFYSPIEVFADPETRQKRIDFIAKANPDVGFRTNDLDFMTDITVTEEGSIFGWDDDEDDDEITDEVDFDELEKASAANGSSLDFPHPQNPNAGIFDMFRAFGVDVPEDDEEDDEDRDPYDGIDPDQVLFFVREEDDPWGGDGTQTVVYITPKEYFETEGYMYDQYFDSGLPKCFEEVSENTFTYRGSVDEARNRLLSDGFVEDSKFAEFMRQTDC